MRSISTARDVTVALRPYFSQLYKSLSASMFSGPAVLSIEFEVEVEVDESLVDADKSVSRGTIVTELVINALKHAFSEHRHGRIAVRYRDRDGRWTLSATDDGVGMSSGSN